MSTSADDPSRREMCAQCGFDSDLYNRADTISSQRVVAGALAHAVEGLDDDAVATRLDDTTWSIAEYLDHVREMVFANRFAIESALAEPGIDLGGAPAAAPDGIGELRLIDVATALAAVADEYGSMHRLLKGLGDDRWTATATFGGEPHSVAWHALHVLHDGIHHLGDIGRIRHSLGRGATTETGTIAQINVSGGGVPKRPVDRVSIGPRGLAGDTQSDRRHHGRPTQAVCLWSADVISELRAEGQPIEAGSAGENITIAGIDWAAIRPGTRLDVGSVPLLVTDYAEPCHKNARWFRRRRFKRILHDRYPGSSRIYAIPLASGEVSAGDPVTVEPQSG